MVEVRAIANGSKVGGMAVKYVNEHSTGKVYLCALVLKRPGG
jgi:hypothetical protein